MRQKVRFKDIETKKEKGMGNDCKGLIGKVFGHNYQNVYNLSEPKHEVKMPSYLSGKEAESVLNALRSKTLVHSICKRCGNVIT